MRHGVGEDGPEYSKPRGPMQTQRSASGGLRRHAGQPQPRRHRLPPLLEPAEDRAGDLWPGVLRAHHQPEVRRRREVLVGGAQQVGGAARLGGVDDIVQAGPDHQASAPSIAAPVVDRHALHPLAPRAARLAGAVEHLAASSPARRRPCPASRSRSFSQGRSSPTRPRRRRAGPSSARARSGRRGSAAAGGDGASRTSPSTRLSLGVQHRRQGADAPRRSTTGGRPSWRIATPMSSA